MSQDSQLIQAIKELIEDGDMSWADGVKMYRSETGSSLGYCLVMGIVGLFKSADKNYHGSY